MHFLNWVSIEVQKVASKRLTLYKSDLMGRTQFKRAWKKACWFSIGLVIGYCAGVLDLQLIVLLLTCSTGFQTLLHSRQLCARDKKQPAALVWRHSMKITASLYTMCAHIKIHRHTRLFHLFATAKSSRFHRLRQETLFFQRSPGHFIKMHSCVFFSAGSSIEPVVL